MTSQAPFHAKGLLNCSIWWDSNLGKSKVYSLEVTVSAVILKKSLINYILFPYIYIFFPKIVGFFSITYIIFLKVFIRFYRSPLLGAFLFLKVVRTAVTPLGAIFRNAQYKFSAKQPIRKRVEQWVSEWSTADSSLEEDLFMIF